jgi:thiol-disulfide isomerase/thioredoxin
MVKKIIRMGASWCMPCHAFGKTFDKVSEMEEYKDIEFKSIDVEEDEEAEELVEKYGVRNVPTTLILDENNEIINKVIGNVSFDDFTKTINDALENK